MKKCITLMGDPELNDPKALRQAVLEVTTRGGANFREHVVYVPGMAENPMTTEEVENKCRGLLIPVLGEDRSQRLIHMIWNLEQVRNVRELRPLLSAS
jgi:2-methylcitrate dehydratase PrpD